MVGIFLSILESCCFDQMKFISFISNSLKYLNCRLINQLSYII